MQIVAVPLFNKDMMVEAYMFRYLKENNLFSKAQATNIFDGASHSEALETLDYVGLEAFTLGKPLFIPINDIMLMGSLEKQCKEPPEKLIFVFENPLKKEQMPLYLPIIQNLCNMGYRFACNYPYDFQKQDPVLACCSYIFLSQREERKEQTEKILGEIKAYFPALVPIAVHIYNNDTLKSLYAKEYAMYESRFYKIPPGRNKGEVPPLKADAIRLINTVQDDGFEFEKVADIVQGDPALTILLLKIINAPTYGSRDTIKTIAQAVSLLGVQEVRKWVTTAVYKSLADDRPSEITKISLIRAKFAENLASFYKLDSMAGQIYLMGLFSAIDIILHLPLPEALSLVNVSEVISSALLEGKGELAPVLKMVTDYENANWSSVSRHIIVNDIKEDALSKAYIDALIWYRNTTLQESEPTVLAEGMAGSAAPTAG